MRKFLLLLTLGIGWCNASAQLSTNPDKFLGNITTSYQVDYGSEKFYTLWNQITPENESKWSSIEGSRRGSFNWGSDAAYNYAKLHNFPFKFHCLIWGAQYPSWLNSLSTSEQYKAIVEWMDAIKKHYPDLPMIDVVNEAVPGHQPAPYKEALGGDGKTGYDWIIKAFEMAHERWPDAILIYNDYNTFQWQRTQFIDLVRTLRDAGAPIDAYGCQSHDLTDMNVNDFKAAMNEIQTALRMPMYSTEYDIGTADDNKQKQRYMEQIPYMWEADYCAGITLWGYIYGHTWVTDGNSGIIRDGKDRPAMEWLRGYMKSEAARTAKSPFPGMVKEASVYVKPASLNATMNEPMSIEVRARLKTKQIERVELYAKNKLVSTMTQSPYTTEYAPTASGRTELKAVVVATDGTKYERLSGITAWPARAPFRTTASLPGTLQVENFDIGAEGEAFHDSDSRNEGNTSYRTNGGGVDVIGLSSGYGIGYTSTGEWLEYTVNVKEEGYYDFDAYIATINSGSAFSLALNTDKGLQTLTERMGVAPTGNWSTYKANHGRLMLPLQAGQQVIRLKIDEGGFDIDRIVFKRVDLNNDIAINVTAADNPASAGTTTTLSATVTAADEIKNVKFYVDNILLKTITTAPYEASYKPTAKGEYVIKAIATDAEGRESKVARYVLKVNPKRTAYKGVITVPGTIEAENFDRGEEGFTFHDSDSKDEGNAGYRTDNEGVDIIKGSTGYGIGYTATGEWLEYSIDVKEPGKYAFEATVSSGVSGSSFSIGLVQDGKVTSIGRVNVPQTGNSNWDTYRTVKGSLSKYLEVGPQVLRFSITGASCNIDKVVLTCTLNTDVPSITAEPKPTSDERYNLAGQRVGRGYRGIVIMGGRKVLVK